MFKALQGDSGGFLGCRTFAAAHSSADDMIAKGDFNLKLLGMVWPGFADHVIAWRNA